MPMCDVDAWKGRLSDAHDLAQAQFRRCAVLGTQRRIWSMELVVREEDLQRLRPTSEDDSPKRPRPM